MEPNFWSNKNQTCLVGERAEFLVLGVEREPNCLGKCAAVRGGLIGSNSRLWEGFKKEEIWKFQWSNSGLCCEHSGRLLKRVYRVSLSRLWEGNKREEFWKFSVEGGKKPSCFEKN